MKPISRLLSTINRKLSTVNCQPSTVHRSPSTVHCQPSTANRQRSTVPRSKRAQSEMIGFALIIIIVAVLIVVFISLSMNENEDESLNSFELESFVQATLEYTTNCTARGDYIPLRKVIFRCIENQTCSSGEDPCIILENDIQAIVENSWQACPECRIRGYEFNITQAKEGSPIPDDIYHLAAGNVTIFSKTAVQNFDSGVDVHFKAYYASQ